MNETTNPLQGLYGTAGKIRTFTGKFINPFKPTADDIDIVDIAHALSNQCRFAGHTKRFYSVAEHSLTVMNRVPTKHELAALMHDASEAYLLDIPTPIKDQLPGYREAEDNLMQVIATKYGFEWPMDEVVKIADRHALEWEWQNIVLSDQIPSLDPKSAEHLFITVFNRLTAGHRIEHYSTIGR